MSLVDDRGRVFGRFNAVDAFVVALVLVMMPAAYAAYALFRTPPATLTDVEPRQLTMLPSSRVRIAGTNLRPFMRVSFDTTQARTFLIGSTTSAEVDLPNLEPGTYDVVLYDYAREVDRLRKALTILPRTPAPSVIVSVSGSFIGLSEANANAIQRGMKFTKDKQVIATVLAADRPRVGEVLIRTGDTLMSVHLPGQYALQAALDLECFLESTTDGSLRCLVYGPLQPTLVATDSVLPLPMNSTTISFQIAEVHPPGPPSFVRVKARAIVPPDGAVRMRAGDVDSTMPAYSGAWLGRVEAVNGNDVTLTLPVQHLANGWKYRTQFLKLGAGLRFETQSAVLNATIADLTPMEASPK
jgi:hypothetical protein